MIAALKRGDDAARVALVRAWGPTVLRWGARLGGAGVDPEDVAHDVFLTVFDKLEGLRADAAFPTWLFQVVRREVNRHRKRAWLRRWLPGASPDVATPGVDPAQRDLVRKVQAALDALPAD